jgi:serine/threonine protein kinase
MNHGTQTDGDAAPDPARTTAASEDWASELREAARSLPDEAARKAMRARHAEAVRTAAAPAPVQAPARARAPAFPGFEIVRELAPGVGGMGTVYLARECSLDRMVALKTVNQALETAAGREIFRREARAAARLDHPQIVRILSFDPMHDPPYYVMEYVDGEPIHEACRGKGPEHIAALLEQIARALAYAHARGILHRDIKPDNILVDRQGVPRITDFGLASRWGRGPGERDPTPVMGGTPLVSPPEGWADGAAISPAVDLYGLGVTMYRLLTGQYPFRGDTPDALQAAIQAGRPPLPTDLHPDTPEPLQRVCLKAMEHDPLNRYRDAADMADDLRRFLDGQEVHARPTRYQQELAGRLRHHETDIRQWQEQRLVSIPDMDRLLRPYYRLLIGSSHWREFSHRFPWEALLLRLGGWLVLVSCLLWPWFYWDDLSRLQRLAGVGIPCLLLNAAGLLLPGRDRRLNATIFLSTGALLLPVFVEVLLVEYEWLRWPGTATAEWHGTPENPELPTNAQLTIATAAFVGYCLLLFRRLRAVIFTAWIGVGTYLLAGGAWMILGLKERIHAGETAFPLLSGLALPAAFYLAGRIMTHGRAARWAAAFYAFFPVPLVVLLSLLAVRGAMEWFGAELAWDSRGIGHALIANGLAYGALALFHHRSRHGFVRGWSLFFLLIMPVSILVPLNLLFYQGPPLFALGGSPVRPYELAAITAALALTATGIRLGRETLTVPGLCGLAVSLFRITGIHFPTQKAWALGLLLTGAAAMLGGWILHDLRHQTPTPDPHRPRRWRPPHGR